MTISLATFAALLLPALLLVAAAAAVFRRLSALQRRVGSPCDPWLADLSVERYRPMVRLLNSDDIRFLRSQPGVTPAMLHRLRQQRCQIFRGYLRSLELDFHQASDALVQVMLQSQVDRRDLIPVLLGSRLKFATAAFSIRCRLVLYRWNIGQEPVQRLLGLFEGLQLELLAWTPTPQGVALVINV
jgi:hypothetical protein